MCVRFLVFLLVIPEILSLVLLGAIQGITEYLPVSSTAHVLLFAKIFNINLSTENFALMLILLQTGTCLASMCYFKSDIKIILSGLLRLKPQGDLKSTHSGRHLLLLLITAMLPAVIIGLVFHSFSHSTSTIILGSLFGSLMILFAEKYYSKHKIKKSTLTDLLFRDALLIGVFQIAALIPGVSRSLSTMIGGYFCNCSRSLAVHFSFLLGMCMSFAASIYEVVKYRSEIFSCNLSSMFFAVFVSFIIGLLSISVCLSFLKKHGLLIFALYRVLFVGLFLCI